jgi:hypothetical protein
MIKNYKEFKVRQESYYFCLEFQKDFQKKKYMA